VIKIFLRITDVKGNLVEEGPCEPDAIHSIWVYAATARVAGMAGVTITATAYDRPGNSGEGSVRLAGPYGAAGRVAESTG
jgi:hypothetical protein